MAKNIYEELKLQNEELKKENEMLNLLISEMRKLAQHMSKANAQPLWKANTGKKYLCGYRQIKEKIRFPFNHVTEIYRLQIRIVTAEDEKEKRLADVRSALSWVKEKINCDFSETLIYDDGDAIFCEVCSAFPFIEEQEIPEPITFVSTK